MKHHRTARPGWRRLAAATAVVALFFATWLAAAPPQEKISPSREQQLFAQIDGMLVSIGEIMGIEVRKPIPRSLLTREEIRHLVEKRLDEETTPEEIRLEELFLKRFGFVDEDFDLAKQLVEILTEQATALYDFKTKKLYLATWTPPDMQEFALAHELAHALADQHFNLTKYVKKSKGADEDLARSAVLEGQASWVMTEYVMRQGGRSMVNNSFLAIAASAASRVEAKDYPVYSSAPLYVRESLLFPYTHGLMFQQAIVDRKGAGGFAEVFRRPPASTQHILQPETYLEGRKPTKPRLPKLKRRRGLKKVAQGQIGQFDHLILLKQYLGDQQAESLAPKWRGGRYALLEDKAKSRAILLYTVEWETASDAQQYFGLYPEICKKKWKTVSIDRQTEHEVAGHSETGRFLISRQGAVVTSIEGMPGKGGDVKLAANR